MGLSKVAFRISKWFFNYNSPILMPADKAKHNSKEVNEMIKKLRTDKIINACMIMLYLAMFAVLIGKLL